MLTFENVHNILKNEVATVTFTKVDGSERVMRCTLNEGYLPESNAEKTVSSNNKNTIRAFDLDIKEWRSFRVASVKQIATTGAIITNG